MTEHAGIRSLRVHQSTLFTGTNRGVYRLNAGTWEHLQLPVDDIVSVNSFVVSDDHIYVAVLVNILEGEGTPQENFMPLWKGEKLSWWVFRSADGGNSWTDITPVEARDLMRVLPQIALLASEKTLLVIEKDNGMVVRSTDRGDTWTYIESSGIAPMQFSVGSTLTLTPNTFYTAGSTGIHRSTDGGQTWHRFNTRFESRVDGLVSFMARSAPNQSPALYARVAPNLVVIAYASPATDFSGDALLRVVMVLLVSLLYVSICYLLGMLLSVWTKEAATTLILSMFIWGILTIVYSNIATFAVAKFPPHKRQPEKEALQQIEQLWEDFKAERDTYILKKWGYKYPTSAISQIADGPLMLSINMRSPGELGFQEFYEFKPIHILDVSKFQEVLGYQEPLRIDYVNDAEELLKRREDIGERNRQLGRNISRLSFADAYRFAIGAITGTDRESYND